MCEYIYKHLENNSGLSGNNTSAANGGGNTRCSLPLIVSTARMIALGSSLLFLLWKHNVIQNHFDVKLMLLKNTHAMPTSFA